MNSELVTTFVNALKSKFEKEANKVTSWSNTTNNDNYPSEKLVKDSLDDKVDKESGKGLFSGSYTDLTNKPTIPDVSGKIDTAGTGLSKSETTLNHSNSVTAQTSAVFKKIKYDAQGHITDTDNVTASDLPSHSHSNYLTEVSLDGATTGDGDTITTDNDVILYANFEDSDSISLFDGRLDYNPTTNILNYNNKEIVNSELNRFIPQFNNKTSSQANVLIYRNKNGIVHFQMQLNGTATTTGIQTICSNSLPENFRPSTNLDFFTWNLGTNSVNGKLGIRTTGEIKLEVNATNIGYIFYFIGEYDTNVYE